MCGEQQQAKKGLPPEGRGRLLRRGTNLFVVVVVPSRGIAEPARVFGRASSTKSEKCLGIAGRIAGLNRGPAKFGILPRREIGCGRGWAPGGITVVVMRSGPWVHQLRCGRETSRESERGGGRQRERRREPPLDRSSSCFAQPAGQ